MRSDDRFTIPLIHHDIARHVFDRGRLDQQHRARMRQIAKLDRVEVGKIRVAALADHFTDAAVCCYSEIVFRDRAFQFGQHVIVRFLRLGLIIRREVARNNRRASAANDEDEAQRKTSKHESIKQQ